MTKVQMAAAGTAVSLVLSGIALEGKVRGFYTYMIEHNAKHNAATARAILYDKRWAKENSARDAILFCEEHPGVCP